MKGWNAEYQQVLQCTPLCVPITNSVSRRLTANLHHFPSRRIKDVFSSTLQPSPTSTRPHKSSSLTLQDEYPPLMKAGTIKGMWQSKIQPKLEHQDVMLLLSSSIF